MYCTEKNIPSAGNQQHAPDRYNDQNILQGYPDTVRETNERDTLPINGIYNQSDFLTDTGCIYHQFFKSGAILLIDPEYIHPGTGIPIPLLGRVSAGLPVEACEDIETYLTLPRENFSDGEYFALRVKGDSMTGCGIYDRDIVIIRKQPVAENGDIVVAMLEDEVTLKRFKRIRDKIFLMPENPLYQPIMVNRLKILGKLVALYRLAL